MCSKEEVSENADLRTLWRQDLIAVRPLAVGDSLRGTQQKRLTTSSPAANRDARSTLASYTGEYTVR
jgi:hypothetical protein